MFWPGTVSVCDEMPELNVKSVSFSASGFLEVDIRQRWQRADKDSPAIKIHMEEHL